jgi:hypothetical protein
METFDILVIILLVVIAMNLAGKRRKPRVIVYDQQLSPWWGGRQFYGRPYRHHRRHRR